MRSSWTEAVEAAVRRHVASSGSRLFTRQALIDAELDGIGVVSPELAPELPFPELPFPELPLDAIMAAPDRSERPRGFILNDS